MRASIVRMRAVRDINASEDSPWTIETAYAAAHSPVWGATAFSYPGPRRVSGVPASYARYVKPLVDRVAAGVGLVLLAPGFLAVAVAIRVSDGSPILYRQTRIGKNREPFRVIKFRTMVPDAYALGGGYAPAEMDLITPIGHVLRRTSIDELPQLLNVLRGEMSLVGPRPTLPDQVDRYSARQLHRLDVLPGITGLAQVEGRDRWTWSKRIERDLFYVDNLSATLDCRVLWKTLRIVFGRSGYIPNQSADDIDDL